MLLVLVALFCCCNLPIDGDKYAYEHQTREDQIYFISELRILDENEQIESEDALRNHDWYYWGSGLRESENERAYNDGIVDDLEEKLVFDPPANTQHFLANHVIVGIIKLKFFEVAQKEYANKDNSC